LEKSKIDAPFYFPQQFQTKEKHRNKRHKQPTSTHQKRRFFLIRSALSANNSNLRTFDAPAPLEVQTLNDFGASRGSCESSQQGSRRQRITRESWAGKPQALVKERAQVTPQVCALFRRLRSDIDSDLPDPFNLNGLLTNQQNSRIIKRSSQNEKNLSNLG